MAQAWYDTISKELIMIEDEIHSVIHSNNEELNAMCHYTIDSGGKRIRPAMCVLAYLACGGKDISKAVSLGSAYEIVHTASLIHDDINDKSEIRRGRRTLHKEFCVSKAIVAGDYMMAKGFQALGATSNDIVDVIVEAASRMSEGEFIQKDFEHITKVTEDDYYEIINGKTSKLIEACAKSGAFLADAEDRYVDAIGDYAHGIGMAFQMIDDTLDVIGDINNTGKRVGLDLIEGKPTLPTILAMSDPTYGPRIAEVFMKTEPSEEEVYEALTLIRKTDAIELCRQKAEAIIDEAIERIMPIPESIYRDSFVSLAKYIISRDR